MVAVFGPVPEGLLLSAEFIPLPQWVDPLPAQLIKQFVHCMSKGTECVWIGTGSQTKYSKSGVSLGMHKKVTMYNPQNSEYTTDRTVYFSMWPRVGVNTLKTEGACYLLDGAEGVC